MHFTALQFPMQAFLAALVLFAAGGVGALLLAASKRASTACGVGGALAGSAAGLVAAFGTLGGGPYAARWAWAVPGGSFSLGLDALSGFFLVPIFLLTALAAVFGAAYWRHERAGRTAVGWLFYNGLTASMALVVASRNGVLFLVAWEVMSLASFFLVTFEHAKAEVRRAGWIYLVAMHIGTAFLVLMFCLLGRGAASLDFDALAGFASGSPAVVAAILACATVGFGTKAGFMPLHGWLPEAHPAAPSHISAVMSGVMIKTGIYGLVRVLALAGGAPAWFGWTLIAIGASSGILGVLAALAQHDIKRLLAYHSVENIGIIALGLGLGVTGVAYDLPIVAFLGFAGGLFHVLNHALFKGLLFLGAGAVAHAAGTRELDRLGGLLKRMPWTGVAFLVGSAAISGLPPLNGFASEFLVYFGGFRSLLSSSGAVEMGGVAALTALALIGGLAAACFAKAFGVIFLGEPRTAAAAETREAPRAMRAPMLVLAAACVLAGVGAPWIVRALGPVVAVLTAGVPAFHAAAPDTAVPELTAVTVAGLVLAALVGALALARRAALARRPVAASCTWGCGYAAPTARMQYTASSFAAPLLACFRPSAGRRRAALALKGPFPAPAAFDGHGHESWRARMLAAALDGARRRLVALHWMQHGRIHLYVLYIAVTLLLLLVLGL